MKGVGVSEQDRYGRLMDLFDRACGLPDVERQALVGRTRTEEPELARDLEALLDHDRALGDAFMSRDGRIEAVATALARDDADDAGPDRRLGTILSGRYRLEEHLGSGAVGQVYRALDQATGDTVAIKLLNRYLVDDRRQAQRLGREFRAIARIDHPGCLRVFAEGADGADRYLVMEYVAGGNLTRLVGAPREVLLPVLIGVAAALDDVHGHGIIHRDLKPANVLLVPGQPPSPKLADFGTVKLLGATSTRITDTGAVIGTVDYLAPEALGRGEIDSRSDLYSLGCVMFELWAGRPVFTGAPLDRLNARLDRIAPALSSVARGVPAGLDDLVARLLARDPARRPRRAVDVARDLMAVWAELASGDGGRGRPPVGREPVMAAARTAVVRAALAAVDDTAVRLVALSGAAELGAAALADALATGGEARELIVVRDASTGEPFAPFTTALAALDRAIGEPSPAAPHAIRGGVAAAGELAADDAYAARRPLVRAVAARVRVLHQRRPAVLMLGDLHRAAGSAVELALELVAELASSPDLRSDGVPPTLIVTIGPPGRAIVEAAAQEVPGTAAEARSPGARAVAYLAGAASDDPLLADGAVGALLDRSDLRLGARGWSVRIIELAPELAGAVREVLAGRWAALAEAHRPILECAAVVAAAAPAFTVELLGGAGGAGDGESRRALAAAERLAIVRGDPPAGSAQMYRFDPPQMGDAIHALIEPAARANLHARVGALLERGGGASPALVAFHAIRGRDERFAFDAACRAGEAARAERDHVAAARHLELALAHVAHLDPAAGDGVRDDCTERLAELLLASNRPAEAAEQLRPLAARPAARWVRARRLRRLGAALVRTADPAAGVAVLEEGLVVLGRRAGSWGGRRPPGEAHGEERALLHRELATAYRWIDVARAFDHLREVVRLARLDDDAPPADRGLARATGDALARSAHELVPGPTLALFSSDPADARRCLDRRARRAEASGDRLLHSLAALERGCGLWFLGDWPEAARDLMRAEGLALELGARGLAAEAAGRHAWLAAFRGDLDTTARTGRRLTAQAGPLRAPALAALGAELLAIAALLDGRPRDALAHLDHAALPSRGGCHGWDVVTALVAAEAALCVVGDEGPDAVPELDTRLKRSLRVMGAKPRARLASGYHALVSGVRASRVGWVRLARVRFARALGGASDMTPLAPMVRARLAIEGCRLGDSRATATATLDAVASEIEATDLAGLGAWLGRTRRSHGL
jgi:hypothetical protein